MPGVSGELAVNTRVHSNHHFRTRGCGCTGHPAFPTPSLGRNQQANPGRNPPRDREGVSRNFKACLESMLYASHASTSPPMPQRHMWTAPIGKHFLTYRTIWSASVICPACWCGFMTAGPDEIRLPWSLSLRRASWLVTLSGCPWRSVVTVSFITSFVLTKLEPANSSRMLLETAR